MIGGAAQQPPMTPPPPWFPPRVAPSPPAPPPFQWSCSCFNVSDDQIDANFTCGGELHMRAYLSCNGIPYKSWKSLGSCNHATGCGEAGCNPPWDRNYNYALLVSSYRPQHCLILPPSPPLPPQSPQPPAAPYPFWCERQQVETWNSQGHQPANTITSLSAVAFGIYGFTSTNAKDAHYRICCATLILTGLGSAAHHWWPRGFEWQDKEVDTHALDWVAMLMLCSAALSYAINVLLAVLLRPPGGAAPLASLQTLRRVQSASLLACFGAAWFATSAFTFRHYVIIAFMFTAIAAHGILFLALALRLRAGQCVDKDRLRCVAYAYAAAVVLIIVAVPSLVVEWSSCPPWLFRSGMSLHGVWHVAVFLLTHIGSTVLLYIDTPGARWSSPCSSVPWLLFSVHVPCPEEHMRVMARTSEGGAELELAESPDQRGRLALGLPRSPIPMRRSLSPSRVHMAHVSLSPSQLFVESTTSTS